MFFRRRKSPAFSNRIFIRDMIVETHIGVFEREKGQRQRVCLNVTADITTWPKSDSIDDTVSYESFVQHIVSLTSGEGHIHLVETLADRIAALCLSENHVQRVAVRVEKLDIYPFAVPGVEIIREKP